MYAKCNALDECQKLFDQINGCDSVMCNIVLAGFAGFRSHDTQILRLFHEMHVGVDPKPSSVTVAIVLPVCARLGAIDRGKSLHSYVMKSGLGSHTLVGNALVSVCAKCGYACDDAYKVFGEITEKDVVSWNTVIAGFAENDLAEHLQCASASVSVANALVSFYSRIGRMGEAEIVFQKLRVRDLVSWNIVISGRDLISWNTMIDGFAQSQLEGWFVGPLRWILEERIRSDSITMLAVIQFCASLSRVDKIKEAHGFSIRSCFLVGKRNVVTCNSIISGYVNYGSHDDAHRIFHSMSERDLTTWNLMIRAYAENQCPGQALSLFHELKNHGMKPDAITAISLLPICIQMASVHLLRQLHGYVGMPCMGREALGVFSHMLDVETLSPTSPNDSYLGLFIRWEVPSPCNSSFEGEFYSPFLTWYQSLISVLRCVDLSALTPPHNLYHALREGSVETLSPTSPNDSYLGLFIRWEVPSPCNSSFEGEFYSPFLTLELGVKPDHGTITAVLSACSHNGLVDKGLKIFDAIDKSPPSGVEIGLAVSDQLFKVESSDIGNYVVLSIIYAAYARWDGVLEIRRLMRTRDLKKPAGCSWIEVENKKNVFIAGDSSHPQRSIIYSTLRILDQQIKEPLQL
ncbi:tetratricopeptide repeat (TPR)-like superfamily protein [Actinidia rufa]|uniref:Tetratricopeptide repeat (TPR)-like superfamily protein n=1 Tax=Actinidia rufa TaxID=165716 RepID=A0A7J0ESE5_9ERIC|nr:tetratricopeptide repeat (TPR)-like superfamily protein [Actinidia rufa]